MLNRKWVEDMRSKIQNKEAIDVTFANNEGAKWLIASLSNCGRSFLIYNLGAGVKRVTTNTDTCPLCKRKL